MAGSAAYDTTSDTSAMESAESMRRFSRSVYSYLAGRNTEGLADPGIEKAAGSYLERKDSSDARRLAAHKAEEGANATDFSPRPGQSVTPDSARGHPRPRDPVR